MDFQIREVGVEPCSELVRAHKGLSFELLANIGMVLLSEERLNASAVLGSCQRSPLPHPSRNSFDGRHRHAEALRDQGMTLLRSANRIRDPLGQVHRQWCRHHKSRSDPAPKRDPLPPMWITY